MTTSTAHVQHLISCNCLYGLISCFPAPRGLVLSAFTHGAYDQLQFPQLGLCHQLLPTVWSDQLFVALPGPSDQLFCAVEKKLPWGVIILLGGGFALSDATEQ
jgi:di/tricarboxylate transporter